MTEIGLVIAILIQAALYFTNSSAEDALCETVALVVKACGL
jgi:hypothetical protein